MRVLLRIEWIKLRRSRLFLITLVIASLIALLSALYMIDVYREKWDFYHNVLSIQKFASNPNLQWNILADSWIGGEHISLAGSLFYVLLPLLACLPFAWSHRYEIKNGYIRNVVTRTNRRNYAFAKYLAIFFSGALIVLLPLVINVVTVACFVPNIRPDSFFDMYYAVNGAQLWSGLFYRSPILYIALFILLDAIYAGLFATLSAVVCRIARSAVVGLLVPFLLCLGLNYLNSIHLTRYSISPITFLRGNTAGSGYASGTFVLLLGLLFLSITFLILCQVRQYDVL